MAEAMVQTDGSALIHACCVAIDGQGLLILGASGSGKSDLALRLIDRGGNLVGDDYCRLVAGEDGRLHAWPAPNIAGLLEVRGVGIAPLPFLVDIPVLLALNLDEKPDRLPERGAHMSILNLCVPMMAFDPFEPSAPIKAEMALRRMAEEDR